MLMNILRFEVKSGLKKISFWVYCLIFFSISFLIVNILGGAIIGASAVMDNTKWNAPYAIAGFQSFFTIVGTIICSAIFYNNFFPSCPARTRLVGSRKPLYVARGGPELLSAVSGPIIYCLLYTSPSPRDS